MLKGKILIDLPNMDSHSKWRTFKTAKEVEEGTFIPVDGPEKGLMHSVFTKQEVERLFAQFQNVAIKQDSRQRWIIIASKETHDQLSLIDKSK